MAAANTVFYYYSITVTYHDPEDEERPFYQNGSYWTQRRITFGPDADYNEALMDFMNDKLDLVELRWVYRCLRIRFPQAYREFQETQRLRLWRRYRPHAP